MKNETCLTGRSRFLRAITAGLLLGAVGCTGATDWHADSQTYLVPFHNGDFPTAAAASLHCAHHSQPTDAVLFNIDAGAILRTDGDIGGSTARLDDADALVGNYEQWPEVSVSEETGAALTSARTVNYRGKFSDLVMLNTYRALNHMELGQNNGARSMLIRASFIQKDIAEKYADELKKAQDDTAKDASDNSNDFDANKSTENANGQTADANKDLLNLKPYGNYVNPFCDYVQGLYFMGAALDQSDKERAAVAFKRAASMEPDNAYIKLDAADADKLANGHKLPPLTYVIFETGEAPIMGEIRVPLPLFLANGQAPLVVLYFPTMQPQGDFVPYLLVGTGDQKFQTQEVCDMDSVILQEFKNALPTITTRMIISASIKAAADAGIRQAVRGQNGFVQIGAELASAAYQAVTSHADLRTWRVLPKQFQVARFETPTDHQLLLTPGDGSGQVTVKLDDAPFNVVYVKSVRRGVHLVARQYVLSAKDAAPKPPAPAVAAN